MVKQLTGSLFLLSTRQEWVCQPEKVEGTMAPLAPTLMHFIPV